MPSPELAEADGLLAIGGDLSPERLIKAYKMGIFPWYNQDEEILWWSPDPRFVLFPKELKVSKSMEKLLKNERFHVTFNTAFDKVINACKNRLRKDQDGTWITDEMEAAYIKLHQEGYAQSVEVWEGKVLVGGLYGIRIDAIFFGESMFSQVSNASKYGFIVWVNKLEKEGVKLIDCQQETDHLASLGARNIKRIEFNQILRDQIK